MKLLREEAQAATTTVNQDLLWGMHKMVLGKYMALRAVPPPLASLPDWFARFAAILTIAALGLLVAGHSDYWPMSSNARGLLLIVLATFGLFTTCFPIIVDSVLANSSRRIVFEAFVQGKALGPFPYRKPYRLNLDVKVPSYSSDAIVRWAIVISAGTALVFSSILIARFPWKDPKVSYMPDAVWTNEDTLLTAGTMAVLGVLALILGWVMLKRTAPQPWPDRLYNPEATS